MQSLKQRVDKLWTHLQNLPEAKPYLNLLNIEKEDTVTTIDFEDRWHLLIFTLWEDNDKIKFEFWDYSDIPEKGVISDLSDPIFTSLFMRFGE